MTTSDPPPDDERLCEYIRAWFKAHAGDPNRWSRNALGKLLKELLSDTGNWKNAPRGNPKKGFRTMQQNQQEENA